MPVPKVPAARLPTIQALRGIAAAMIVMLHALHEAGLAKPGFPLKMGVDLFFVISGFIMVYTTRTVCARAGAWREFVTRRLVRIVPVYWFYTTLLVVVALALPATLQKATIEPLHLALSYLFIPHLGPAGNLHPFLAVGWTLNYEMCFYAVFAALLVLPVRRMLMALTVLFGAAVVAGAWLTPVAGAAYFWTRPIVLGFVAGAWVGHAFLSGVRLPGGAAWLMPVLATALFAFPAAPPVLRPWIIQACAVTLVTLAILPRGMATRPVPRVFGALGDASYSVYLAHPFILTAMALVLRELPAWARFAAGGLAALVGGVVLYRIVERPALVLVRRVLAHPLPRAPVPPPDGTARAFP